ncbi:hypothetical protein D3C81_1807750 [compost metagenome]
MRRLAGIANSAPAPFLLRRDRETANEVDHFALLVRQEFPLFLAFQHDFGGLQKVATVLVLSLSFDIGSDPHLAFFIVENGVAQMIVPHHEGTGVPGAVFINGDKGPPDHMLVVVHHQVFLEVDGAAFSHVELVQRHGAFYRASLADTGDVPQL